MNKQNETDNQRQENTIDNYFEKTSKGFGVWAEENNEGRSYLQIAAETTGDTDENGNQGFDFHIAYHGTTNFLASGIAQTMEKDEFLRQLIFEAASKYFYANDKNKRQ